MELVGGDDLMTQILWMRYFLEAQGMKVSDNVVYQDNQSAMKLEKMEEHQVVSKPGISTYVVFSLLTTFRQTKSKWSIVQRK